MSLHNQVNNTFHQPKAILVVSDTHFGSEDCAPAIFSEFLDWVSAWERRAVRPETSLTEQLEPPDVFILLGDILELEAPRREDLTVPLRDTWTVFDKLFDLRCKKIYVTGNHDEDMSRYRSRSDPSPERRAWDYTCANQSAFIVATDHYPNVPKREEREWVRMGSDYYIFLHGHQFDKLFKVAAVFKFVPAIMARLADIWSGLHPQLGGVCFGLLLASLVTLLANGVGLIHLSSTPFSALVVLIIVFALIGVPWIWTRLQVPVWKRIAKYLVTKPTDKDIETIIEDHYFDPKKFTNPNASTIVFGHTHVPDYHVHYFGPADKTRSNSVRERFSSFFTTTRDPFVGAMTFINSGAWGSPAAQRVSAAPRYTAVYIDATRSLLLRWDDKLKTLKEFVVSSNV